MMHFLDEKRGPQLETIRFLIIILPELRHGIISMEQQTPVLHDATIYHNLISLYNVINIVFVDCNMIFRKLLIMFCSWW